MSEPDISELAAGYESSQQRIDSMTRLLDDEALATVVPCCPAWTVKDLVGHLTGVLEDRNAERMPTGGFDEWTNAQVLRHRDEPMDVVLDTWQNLPLAMTELPPSLPSLAFDAVTHEHDLCHALGIAGDATTDSVRLGALRAAARMSSMLTSAGAPGVIATTEDGDELIAGVAPPIVLHTSRFELMRLVTGRMSRHQATGLKWTGDQSVILDALFADGFFTLQPNDVVEPIRGNG